LVVDYNRFAYARGNPLKYTDPSGHCAFATNENGEEYISKWDCTIDDFAALDWDQRSRWMTLFMQETGVDWYQNILGILDFFSSDIDFQALDGWASYADAGVLQAINDGWRIHSGKGASIGPACAECASTQWSIFFTNLEKSLPDSNVRSQWGIAEQAGVDYGIGIASPYLTNADADLTTKIGLYVGLSNMYRAMVKNEAWDRPIFGWLVDKPLNPRTATSRWFVFGISHGYMGYMTTTSDHGW